MWTSSHWRKAWWTLRKTPREGAINGKIDDQERRVAGYSALMLSLESVKTAFQKLNDLTDFNAGTVTTTPVGVVGAVTTASAVPGRHTIEVQQLAAPQRLSQRIVYERHAVSK